MRRVTRWIDRYRQAPGWVHTTARIAFVVAVFVAVELVVPEWWDAVAVLAVALAVIAWSWWDRMPRWVRAGIVVVEAAVVLSVAAVYVPPPVWAALLGIVTFVWAADVMGFPVIPRRWRRRPTSKAQPPTFIQAAGILSRANEAITTAERTPRPRDGHPAEWEKQARRLEQFAWNLRARGMLGTARTAYDLAARARALAERFTDDDGADGPTTPTVPAGDGPPPASPPTR